MITFACLVCLFIGFYVIDHCGVRGTFDWPDAVFSMVVRSAAITLIAFATLVLYWTYSGN